MASPCQRSLPGKLTAGAQGGQATVGRSLHRAGPGEDGPRGKGGRGNGRICRGGKWDLTVEGSRVRPKAAVEQEIGLITKPRMGAWLGMEMESPRPGVKTY